MAIWGSSIWGEDTWGAPFQATSAQVTNVSSDHVRLDLGTTMAVTASFSNTTNYTVTDITDGGRIVEVVKILSTPGRTTSFVPIQIKRMEPGHTYKVVVADGTLFTVEGNSISVSEVEWTYRRTKTDSVLRSTPTMYNTDAQGTVRTILEAITISDEEIGGA